MLNIKNNVKADMNCKLKCILPNNIIPTALALSTVTFCPFFKSLLLNNNIKYKSRHRYKVRVINIFSGLRFIKTIILNW